MPLNPSARLLPFVLAALSAVPIQAQAQRTLQFADARLPSSGAVAVAVPEGLPDSGAFAQLDRASQGALKRLAKAQDFTGKAGSSLQLHGIGGYDEVLLVGLGSGTPSAVTLENAGGSVAQAAAKSGASRYELVIDTADANAVASAAFGAQLGQYDFGSYRSADPDTPRRGQGELLIRSGAGAAAQTVYATHWQPVAAGVQFARDMVTEPANALAPEDFVARTRKAAAGLPVKIEVLDETQMKQLGMGGILSVGQGSARPPRLLLVSYQGAGNGQRPLALVGKGITFDSGGISIKPGTNMWKMKTDMSGAAAVTGAVLGLAGRGAKVNAVAVAPLAENMPSGSAARPGDVVRTASGKTFEIVSTDAEGRNVLVDALWYVQRQHKPAAIIDIATLTGSIVTALGGDYAGLFARDDALADKLLQAGEASGELLWRMPLRDDYGKGLKSPIADLRHGGGSPGSGTAAYFIGEWIPRELPWAHLDIAGMAWKEGSGSATSPEGATGYGVRLFDRLVRDHYE